MHIIFDDLNIISVRLVLLLSPTMKSNKELFLSQSTNILLEVYKGTPRFSCKYQYAFQNIFHKYLFLESFLDTIQFGLFLLCGSCPNSKCTLCSNGLLVVLSRYLFSLDQFIICAIFFLKDCWLYLFIFCLFELHFDYWPSDYCRYLRPNMIFDPVR